MTIHSIINRSLLILLLIGGMLVSCQEDVDELSSLNAEQQSLIGRAVDFSVSIAEPYQTRVSWIENGTFNDEDLMRIYREYWDKDENEWCEPAYRTYYFYTKYASGTNIEIEKDWRVYPGRDGYNSVADDYHSAGHFVQTDADSITWDDGRTVRFRAWSRSNYANCLTYSETNKQSYYPDFCVAEWVNVSGPTLSIPLVLKHLGSRIAFSPLKGNQLHKVEICSETWEDYKYADNSDIGNNDESDNEHSKTDEQAKEEFNRVLAAYNRMCLPGGVSADKNNHFILKALTQDAYADQSSFVHLEDKPDNFFYHYGAEDNEYIKEKVQHPVFGNVNGSCYMISIPYDMSNESTQGDIITLPACTRFRVYVRDVNGGDHWGTDNYEGKYHIFSLSDIVEINPETKTPILDVDGNKIPKYPNGLELLPGHSYKFNVGYVYDTFSITVSDHFSWEQQDAETVELEDQKQTIDEFPTTGYTWWKDAIHDAIPQNTNEDYIPSFTISNEHEFLEFIRLVNGEAAIKTDGLYRLVKEYRKEGDKDVPVYGWSRTSNPRRPEWVTTEEAAEEGYLFYERYYPAMGDRQAYSLEDYIRDPYSFFDEVFGNHFEVNLSADLDMSDLLLTESIGNTDLTPFMGNFNGNGHTIKNLYMQSEVLFGNITSSKISNLYIESTHPTSLLGSGTVLNSGNYINGITITAPSTKPVIAETLTGVSFVVGCIHVGDATNALVGTADILSMYGCMHAAEGLTSGALLDEYADPENPFFSPRLSQTDILSLEDYTLRPTWSAFMCNYYDTELSPNSHAVGSIPDDYSLWEYIRGRRSHILKAKNDLFIDEEVMPYDYFYADVNRVCELYGLAPWKAMNYAIYDYNSSHPTQRCDMHYIANPDGYSHRYPQLVPGAPGSNDGTGLNYSRINPLTQPN